MKYFISIALSPEQYCIGIALTEWVTKWSKEYFISIALHSIALAHLHVIFNTNKIPMQYCILLVLHYSIALASFFCLGTYIPVQNLTRALQSKFLWTNSIGSFTHCDLMLEWFHIESNWGKLRYSSYHNHNNSLNLDLWPMTENMYLWNTMPPLATKSRKAIFSMKKLRKSKSRSQGHWPWCPLKGHH